MKFQALSTTLILSPLLLLGNVSAFSSVAAPLSGISPTTATTTVVDKPVVTKPSAAPATGTRIPRGVHAPIKVLTSPQDLYDFLNPDDASDDRICVVKYHASWCKTCHRMKPKFQQFVNQHGDWYQGQDRFSDCTDRELLKEGKYRFAEIEVSACKELFQRLNINKLPSVHLFKAGGQQISGFPIGGKRFSNLQEQLDYYEQVRLGQPIQVDSSFSLISDTTFTPEILQELIHGKDESTSSNDWEEEEDIYTEFDL